MLLFQISENFTRLAKMSSPDRIRKELANERSPLTDVRTGIDISGLDGLTLHEKKCVLINREIDAMGMGRYQWYIWGLCGFGYFLDLLWAHAFGMVLSPLQQELGFGNNQSGNISTSFNAGLTAGAFFWGFLSDLTGIETFFGLVSLEF